MDVLFLEKMNTILAIFETKNFICYSLCQQKFALNAAAVWGTFNGSPDRAIGKARGHYKYIVLIEYVRRYY